MLRTSAAKVKCIWPRIRCSVRNDQAVAMFKLLLQLARRLRDIVEAAVVAGQGFVGDRKLPLPVRRTPKRHPQDAVVKRLYNLVVVTHERREGRLPVSICVHQLMPPSSCSRSSQGDIAGSRSLRRWLRASASASPSFRAYEMNRRGIGAV